MKSCTLLTYASQINLSVLQFTPFRSLDLVSLTSGITQRILHLFIKKAVKNIKDCLIGCMTFFCICALILSFFISNRFTLLHGVQPSCYNEQSFIKEVVKNIKEGGSISSSYKIYLTILFIDNFRNARMQM